MGVTSDAERANGRHKSRRVGFATQLASTFAEFMQLSDPD